MAVRGGERRSEERGQSARGPERRGGPGRRATDGRPTDGRPTDGRTGRTGRARPGPARRARRRPALPLAIRLALVFFSITAATIAALYLYVAPGLESRLLDSKLTALRHLSQAQSGPLRRTIGSTTPPRAVERIVLHTAAIAGTRVALLSLDVIQSRPRVTTRFDSAGPAASPIGQALATVAAHSGRIATGTESTGDGTMAEAVVPLRAGGRVAAAIVYATPESDILETVSTVRREIVVGGAAALLAALLASWLISRAIARRVRRLERAAKQVTEGRFADPIPVDSRDELGQLAVAFNEMQQQLQRVEQARKRFIATASHELRTPVFSLGGFVELLQDEDLDAETRRRFLDQVRDQAQRLAKLSVDLLDLSRLGSGTLELREEHVDIGELTRSVSAEFEVSAASHDAHLRLRLPENVDAHCDPVRVAQILRILIDNALRHTDPGTDIQVTAHRDRRRLSLAVRDDGAGMDAATQAQIFEAFYTADDGHGSGLGLAIASELAERMDGRLSVRSRPGSTTFTLEIPA